MEKVHAHLDLNFAGETLPVTQSGDGHDVVPLKPITDLFGLGWERQRKKVNEEFPAKLYGAVTVPLYGGTPYTAIRLDRVQIFLARLSPSQIRAGGNKAGADYLEEKIEEWADVLHQYEVARGTFTGQAVRQQAQQAKERDIRLKEWKELRALVKERRSAKEGWEYRQLDRMVKELAEETGLPLERIEREEAEDRQMELAEQ
ncbi:phage antirepressor N-terminal domain-containing protein [Thiohalorhabdus sp.]|uniref:phage antirepressor N-terminal domain-containing protein n=1 Tax=Thiohalorhabdus sp. TaxID=3094134 RepID=UPI003980A671